MRSLVLILTLSLGFSAHADMRTFLKSCGYGTLVGAGLGLASLAVSENPGGKINNVARGASLGLYAGIGYGWYLHQKQSSTPGSVDMAEAPVFYLTPVMNQRSVQGLQANWHITRF